ncbi:helix-turn-helix transcriptional regulator [Trinickia sp. YCB016]
MSQSAPRSTLNLSNLYTQARQLPGSAFRYALLDMLQDIAAHSGGTLLQWYLNDASSACSRGFDVFTIGTAWHVHDGPQNDILSLDMRANPRTAVVINWHDSRMQAPGMASWRRFNQTFGIRHQMGIGLPLDDERGLLLIYMMRDDTLPPYTADDAARLTQAAPHLLEAWQVNRLCASVAGGLIEGPVPMALVAPDGWMLYPNAAFVDAWAAMAALEADIQIPFLPRDWLQPGGAGIPHAKFSRLGWNLVVEPAADGYRVELRTMLISETLHQLTSRELEVARLYNEGYSHKEIGGILRLSPNTVRVHLRNVFKKLEISSRGQLRIRFRPQAA